jgi:transmembrane sensor
MNEYDRDIFEIISSVLGGNPSSEDIHRFNQWLKDDEGNRKFYESVSQSMQKKEELTVDDKKRIFAKVQASIIPAKKPRKINLWVYTTAVASVSILISLTIFSLFTKPGKFDKDTYIETTTPFGVKSKISLPDGTLVYLNSGSWLKYPTIFRNSKREVFLRGEGYFEVKKDPKHAFIVKTDSLQVKVYGTHFNVKAYPDEEFLETTLVEGSVGLFKNSDLESDCLVKLLPSQRAAWDKYSNHIEVTKVDAELTISWINGKCYFEHEKMTSIAQKLERNFNVNIKIQSKKLMGKSFFGLFDKNRNIFQILDIMKLNKNFNYKMRNDTIILY